MSLSDEYKRQFSWRSWSPILEALPSPAGQSILDLGCAVGDQAAELVARGACVIGLDANDELLREAQTRCLANAEFRKADLRTLTEIDAPVDGIWCSFTAAYFPDLPDVLEAWRARFDRMQLLRDFCGSDFEHVRAEFLDCLTRVDHRSDAKVCCCIATK